MFKNPFSFNGRIRRLEFCLSYILYSVLLLLIQEVIEYNENTGILGLLFIPLLWFCLAQGVKRCHDRGNSGFYVIIPFYIFWLAFAESDEGENEYGINPKGVGNRLEIDEIGKSEPE